MINFKTEFFDTSLNINTDFLKFFYYIFHFGMICDNYTLAYLFSICKNVCKSLFVYVPLVFID